MFYGAGEIVWVKSTAFSSGGQAQFPASTLLLAFVCPSMSRGPVPSSLSTGTACASHTDMHSGKIPIHRSINAFLKDFIFCVLVNIKAESRFK